MISLAISRDHTHLVISFTYNADYVARIKNLPGRRWSKMEGWLVPLTVEAIDRVRELFPTESVFLSEQLLDFQEQRLKMSKVVEAAKTQPVELPKNFVFVTPPFDHQRLAASLLLANPAFALFMEMGTGKTKVVIDVVGHLATSWADWHVNRKKTLVVCPLSVVENWKVEAAKHQPTLGALPLKGSIAQKKKQLLQALADPDGPEIIVTNYESVWRMEDELGKINLGALVLDESTKIKTRTSQQAKAIVRLGKKAERRYILTGTPMPNGPMELFNQIKFLDPTIFGTSFLSFRDRYAVMGGFKNYQIVGWKNMPELSAKLAGISYRVRKSECLDLPDKLYKEYRLDMTDEQALAYDKMATELVTEIEGTEVSVSVVLAKLAKLRQITSGFAYGPGGKPLAFKTNPKLTQLNEILEPVFREGHKVVIWTTFQHEMNLIMELIQKKWPDFHIARFDGSVPQEIRAEQIKAFQEDSRMRVFLGQQRTGGLGITLTAGDYCIYFSNDFSPEYRLQTEDRLHRIGQKNNVTYVDLIMRNTIDVTIQRMLRKKQELSTSIIEQNKLKEAIYGGNLDF
jgi:SNF2 family DNA or RNA helicase